MRTVHALENDNAPLAATASNQPTQRPPLPRTPLDMITQAGDAVQRALNAGQRRQRLQLLLPTNEKQYDFLATESVDYPCSLQAEFEMAVNLSKAILLHVLGNNTPLKVTRIDDAGIEGEPCAVVFTEAKDFLMIVFPTAERLNDIKELAKDEGRTVVLVNPQWNDKGQIISDFGFGPWKKAAMDFLATFAPTYRLVEQRIGAPGQSWMRARRQDASPHRHVFAGSVSAVTRSRFAAGGVVRTLGAYPGSQTVCACVLSHMPSNTNSTSTSMQAYVMAADGSSQALEEFEDDPSYQQLEQMLAAGRAAKAPIFKVVAPHHWVHCNTLLAGLVHLLWTVHMPCLFDSASL